MRGFFAVLTGLAVAAGLVSLLALANHALFGGSAGIPRDLDAVRGAMATAAPEAQVMILGGYFLGALGGGLVAKRIARGWTGAGWIVAAMVLALAATGLVLAPHPLWMQIATIAAPLFAGLVVRSA